MLINFDKIFIALFLHLNFEIILRNSFRRKKFLKWTWKKNSKKFTRFLKITSNCDQKLQNCDFYNKNSKSTSDFQ